MVLRLAGPSSHGLGGAQQISARPARSRRRWSPRSRGKAPGTPSRCWPGTSVGEPPLIGSGLFSAGASGRCAWPGRFKHSPQEPAAVGSRKNAERTREARDHGQSWLVQINGGDRLKPQGGTVVANCQPQGPEIPDNRQVNVGAGAHRRIGHELADYHACEGDNPPQPPVQQGACNEVPRGARRCGVRREPQPRNRQGRRHQHLGHRREQRRGNDEVTTQRVGAQCLANSRPDGSTTETVVINDAVAVHFAAPAAILRGPLTNQRKVLCNTRSDSLTRCSQWLRDRAEARLFGVAHRARTCVEGCAHVSLLLEVLLFLA